MDLNAARRLCWPELRRPRVVCLDASICSFISSSVRLRRDCDAYRIGLPDGEVKVPPEDANAPVGVMSATYTFPDFGAKG